jgi:hypothetical protein
MERDDSEMPLGAVKCHLNECQILIEAETTKAINIGGSMGLVIGWTLTQLSPQGTSEMGYMSQQVARAYIVNAAPCT